MSFDGEDPGYAEMMAAYHLAEERHDGQVYAKGTEVSEDYIEHLSRVRDKAGMMSNWNQYVCAVAWLHDILEDTPTTLGEIEVTFGNDIAMAVEAITRKKGETYAAYIQRVKLNPMAKIVKIADLSDNLMYSLVEGSPYRNLAYRYAVALMTLVSDKK